MDFRALDLNLLRVFDTVMAEGSLTRAAAVLAITQPAASQAVKRLHDALGDVLFVRTASGMRPSARARALWPQVRAALASLQRTLAPDTFDPGADPVSFRLAMADATAAMLAPALLQVIASSEARAQLRVLPLTTRQPSALLEQGEADLAVGHFPDLIAALLAQGDDALLRHRRLYDTRYVCVMRRGHPLARKRLTLDTYCAAHHLGVSFSGRPQGLVDRALAALGRQRQIVLTVNQFFTAGLVVTQSDLLTALPLSLLEATGMPGELLTRELPFDPGAVHVEMVWHLRRETDPAHRWLREAIHESTQTRR
ncbi:MAG: LysR family transcriptional regulator [Ideonella sp.]|nr:LysR family transcriptional regulator [Ideonella sp.]